MNDCYESLHSLGHGRADDASARRPASCPATPIPTTIGDEWESNPFVRVWRGVDEPGDDPCTVAGRPATLLLFAGDYDGGHKGFVRWEDGSHDIVPGSRVERT